MRWAARAALLVASVRASMTWEEAQCVVAGRRIAFFGDSLSRFCYFGFNTFLATGEVRDHEFDVSEGDGENSNDYDSFDTWNDNGLVSDGKNHRMHLRKDFAEYGAHTEYYFIQNVWYDDLDDTPLEADVEIGDADNEGFIADIVAGDETIRSISLDLDADVVVFNMGWWVLKHKYVDYDCGEKWDSKCADWYEEMMELVVENLLVADGRVGVYRTTSCCGEPDDEYDLWIDSIEAMNDVGSRVASAAGASVVDIFPLYGLSDLPTATFDMKHANVASCHEWNELILRAVDDAAGTACFPPAPTPRPSHEPTYAPSYAPTAPSYAPTAAPTAREPTPGPVPAPTPRPSAAPSPGWPAGCVDDEHWHKKNAPSKDCAWVSDYPGGRCLVVGADDRVAHESCDRACGCSAPPTPRPSPVPPSVAPAPAPTPPPTAAPAAAPTPPPTAAPVAAPPDPTPAPRPAPSPEPSPEPSLAPSPRPTPNPTPDPTPDPTPAPTPAPTVAPGSPTKAPVFAPTPAPVLSPTAAPVATSPRPTAAPAPAPTPLPGSPTRSPVAAPTPAPVAPSPAPVAPTPAPVVSAAAAATATDAAAGSSDDEDDDDIESASLSLPAVLGILAALLVLAAAAVGATYYKLRPKPAFAPTTADANAADVAIPVESDDAPFSPTRKLKFGASAAGSPADRLRRLRQDSLEGAVSRQALDDHLVELIDHLDHTTALARDEADPPRDSSWSAPDGVSVQVEMAADPPAPPADLSPMNVVVEDPFTDDEDDHEAHIHLDEPTSPLPSHVLARLAEKPRAADV